MNRVLVVEDSATQALKLRQLLELNGLRVEFAQNGEEALAKLSGGDFDLIISDVLMPGLSGYAFCKRVKSDPVRCNIPLVLLTMLRSPMDIMNALECGADCFITKPYDPAALVHRVNDLLDGRGRSAPGSPCSGVEVTVRGKRYRIRADSGQLLELLLNALEDAVRINRDLDAEQRGFTATRAALEERARHIEDLARGSEEMYRTLMDHSREAVMIVDERGGILEANYAAGALLGRPSDGIVGRAATEFGFPLEPAVQAGDGVSGATGRGMTHRVQRADGSSVLVDVVVVSARVNTRPLRFVFAHQLRETG